MQKKQAKAAGFQALTDGVRIREDEYDYDDLMRTSRSSLSFHALAYSGDLVFCFSFI